nr:response regulator transcription factor [uncultured Agathobaculum sp.]
MRILVLGGADNEKIPQALRRDHLLYDHVPQLGDMPRPCPAGLYDAALLLTGQAGKAAVDEMAGQLPALRADGLSMPLLVVAQRLTARDRIAILDAGADDVLAQPYLLGELLARVRALGRRSPVLQPQLLQAGDLSLDRSHCLLRGPDGEIRLSRKELQLLELFLLHAGQVLPRDTLRQKVWGLDSSAAYNAIEVYLSLVRRKLRGIGSRAQIHAERGIGYYLQA